MNRDRPPLVETYHICDAAQRLSDDIETQCEHCAAVVWCRYHPSHAGTRKLCVPCGAKQVVFDLGLPDLIASRQTIKDLCGYLIKGAKPGDQ